MVNRDLALDLDLFSRGGLEILRAIEQRDYDVLSARPAISKTTKAILRCGRRLRQAAAVSESRQECASRRAGGLSQDSKWRTGTADAVTLDAAYAECRAIANARRRISTTLLSRCPKPKRNAICAIYAFMRQADDLADDESVPMDERRARLDAWIASWRAASAGGETSDPVFVAVRDATVRYRIPFTLLDELVAGVTMDLDRPRRRAGYLRNLY
jgi:phytoene/squalene synthetase